ncbi:YkvA family protein [Phytohabitans houttuyneae]|nr:DUF1232 domain-containing protein [Phytohabitans houttuyneae]
MKAKPAPRSIGDRDTLRAVQHTTDDHSGVRANDQHRAYSRPRIALLVALLIAKPRGSLLKEAMRLLPDVLRLLRRLAADRNMPRGVRIRLVLLMAYLTIPIDIIPDFIPVLGYADDAIIVTLVLRSTVRRAGLDVVRAHWPGSDDGFAALNRLTGLTLSTPEPDRSPPAPPRSGS